MASRRAGHLRNVPHKSELQTERIALRWLEEYFMLQHSRLNQKSEGLSQLK